MLRFVLVAAAGPLLLFDAFDRCRVRCLWMTAAAAVATHEVRAYHIKCVRLFVDVDMCHVCGTSVSQRVAR